MKKINKAALITDVEKTGSSVNSKTGSWRTFKPVIDKSKCIKCGSCWKFCPDNAIKPEIAVDYDFCKGCGICAKECPVKCISMVKEEK